jgi:hypothetical protein
MVHTHELRADDFDLEPDAPLEQDPVRRARQLKHRYGVHTDSDPQPHPIEVDMKRLNVTKEMVDAYTPPTATAAPAPTPEAAPVAAPEPVTEAAPVEEKATVADRPHKGYRTRVVKPSDEEAPKEDEVK